MDSRIRWPAGPVLAKEWSLPRVEVLDRVGSTQDRALALARQGAEAWTVVIAHGQSHGRGRRGAQWESGQGLGLWMSIVLPSESPASPPIPLRLGLALCEATEAALPGPAQSSRSSEVKWPNDVWIAGRKVAGVLVEQIASHTIAGLGVNVFHRPRDFGPELRNMATSLAIEGWDGDPVRFGADVMDAVRRCWTAPTAEALDRLRRRDALRGCLIETADGRTGRGAGFAEDGALRVSGEGEEWRVSTGAVRLLEVGRP